MKGIRTIYHHVLHETQLLSLIYASLGLPHLYKTVLFASFLFQVFSKFLPEGTEEVHSSLYYFDKNQ